VPGTVARAGVAPPIDADATTSDAATSAAHGRADLLFADFLFMKLSLARTTNGTT